MLLQETELLIVGQICKFRVHNMFHYMCISLCCACAPLEGELLFNLTTFIKLLIETILWALSTRYMTAATAITDCRQHGNESKLKTGGKDCSAVIYCPLIRLYYHAEEVINWRSIFINCLLGRRTNVQETS